MIVQALCGVDALPAPTDALVDAKAHATDAPCRGWTDGVRVQMVVGNENARLRRRRATWLLGLLWVVANA